MMNKFKLFGQNKADYNRNFFSFDLSRIFVGILNHPKLYVFERINICQYVLLLTVPSK